MARKGERKIQKVELLDEIEEENIWDAVEWEEVGTLDSDVVFDKDTVNDILERSVEQAWDDGIITGDEMALLKVLKDKLEVDDEVFERIINERKPDVAHGLAEEDEDTDEEEKIVSIVEVEDEEVIVGELVQEEVQYYRKEEEIPERIKPPPKPPEMITFRHSVRNGARPLDRSFDLSKTEVQEISATSRCPHCRSMIRLNKEMGKTSCPICGMRISSDAKESKGTRNILDLARKSYKESDNKTAMELYQAVLEQSPNNKEALFYLQKIKVRSSECSQIMTDARNVSFLSTGTKRMDQLLGGGVGMGDTVLLEGPPFCGKETLLDQMMVNALKKGIPVIYVSTNRAMKDVLRGIIRRLPQFKEYNHKGLIRMYDLFSKHKDDKILKEGHRIFNIDDKTDFQRFQNDLVFVQEELVKVYHGGLLIINSLSPLVSKVDQPDLQKFLQVLIARSKGYRFTNIIDIASSVHPESVVNSVEYLMDGIIEFRETDSKNMMRMKGFSQPILTRDWVDYALREDSIHLVGSFMEERIL